MGVDLDWLTGNGQDPGLLGLGQRQVRSHQFNEGATQLGQTNQQAFAGRMGQADGRQAQQMRAAQLGPYAQFGGAQIDSGPQSQFRQGQMDLYQMLHQQAMGQGPSLAQAQLQQASDANMRQAMALSQSQQGVGGAAMMRNVGNQRAQIGQQMAADSGLLRMQEQMAARNMMGQIASQGRGQDLDMANAQAGLYQQAGLSNQNAANQFGLQQGAFNQQAGMSNQQAGLQQQQMNDQMVQMYLQTGVGLDQAQMMAKMKMEEMKGAQHLGLEQLRQDAYNTAGANRVGMVKSAAELAATVGAA